MHVFQNGPNWGKDVFIPMGHVIGGVDQVGKGWKMLMSALAAGRGMSLPSLSAAGAALTAHVTGAYARVRVQFHVPIGQFEAIQERLGRMAATAYLLDAARRMTCAALDDGHHPAVVWAFMNAPATDRMRVSVRDAMDVHGGKGIIEGPLNYLGSLYRGVPIGITVEGANIVTRSLIQFGQGAIRSHPYLLKEMMALQNPDRVQGLDEFDKAFWGHVGHSIANTFRAWLRNWSGGLLAPAPDAGASSHYYRQLGRHASAFALAVDLALLSLGGGLKRQEMMSGRFGDILSELYLSSAALKRWNDEGRQQDDLPLLAYCMEASFAVIETRFDEIIANFPVRPVAWLLRFLVQPLGPRRRGPSDRVTIRCAEIITNPGAARDRLTVDLFKPTNVAGERHNGVAIVEHAFAMVVAAQPIRDKMHAVRVRDADKALKQGTITADEAAQLKAVAEAVSAAVAVNDFAPEELTSRGTGHSGDKSFQATSHRPAAE
jgi:acyl-CoA dehydrogenase